MKIKIAHIQHQILRKNPKFECCMLESVGEFLKANLCQQTEKPTDRYCGDSNITPLTSYRGV